MSIFSIFLEIAPVLPEVFENIFLSRYLTNTYPVRFSKIQTCFKGLRRYIEFEAFGVAIKL